MKHIHKRFTIEQIKILFGAYLKQRITKAEVEEELGIGKTRFFALLKKFRKNPETFSVTYHRYTPSKLTHQTVSAIESALEFDKQLLDNPKVPIYTYNYSALRDRLLTSGASFQRAH